LVEHQLPKLRVAGSNPVSRSKFFSLKALFSLFFGIICIGFSAIFVRWANVPGPVSAFYRTFIAASVLLIWWVIKPNELPKNRRVLFLTLIGGLFFACDLTVWNISLLISNASIATLLANNAPIWVGLGSMLLFKEKTGWHFWLGLSIAVVGTILIIGFTTLTHARFDLGSTLALLASFFYAGYLLSTQQVRKEVRTRTFMTISVCTSALITFLLCLFSHQTFTGFSTKSWLSLLGMGLVSHLGGWLAINYALGQIRASVASVTLLSQSVITAILAMPLLGEYLTPIQVIGGIIVLSGIFLINFFNNRQISPKDAS
jgi:drug/metabolite transporter (DMT)-like permease